MARPARNIDNPYYQARLMAAERGLRQPHRDELIIMSEEYNAPELLEEYCECVCPVRQKCKNK